LSELAWRRESPDTFKPTSFLAFGNPVSRLETLNHLQETQTGFKFDPLPEAESEVKTIGELFAPERRAVYLGPQASEARFKSEAANFGIIHFATHGMIDNLNPLYSYLLLASEENDGEDGLLEAREVLDLNLHADTVVLSACETARGRIGAGEGVIGMTWAFFAAGARTAIVSQWKVDSGATAELMTDFYRRFRAGADKPEAMRQAALTLLKGPRYSHPFYWASFIVVGCDR
jgi:CHAT domain-containing protein